MNAEENTRQPRRVRGAGYHLDFTLGQRCLVQFDLNGQKFRSVIIGVEQYSFVIAKLPLSPGIQNRMRPGSTVIVRLEQDGTLYGFTSEIVSSALKPAPFIVFAYPGSVEGLQYREHKRTKCMLPASILNSFLNADGLVTDISLGGCRLVIDWRETEKVFNMMSGDDLELRMHLDSGAPQSVPAKLMNVKELKRHYTLGLKFDTGERLKPLAHFIARLEGAWSALENSLAQGF